MKFLEKLSLVIFSIIVLVLSVILVLIGFNFVEQSVFSILISKVLFQKLWCQHKEHILW